MNKYKNATKKAKLLCQSDKPDYSSWKKEMSKKDVECVERSLQKLQSLINAYEQNGTPFEKIFNNTTIKHMRHGGNFYTYRSNDKNNRQIRVLYRYVRDPETGLGEVQCHKAYIKTKNSTEYIKMFEGYVDSFLGRS